MKLQDLTLEHFNFEQNEQAPLPEYSDYENGSYTVVSKVAYLLGV